MHYRYDASQDKCPLPLVKLRVMLKKMLPPDTCWIRISDEGSKQDIPKLLIKQGYQFSSEQIDINVVELTIKAKG